MSRLYLYTTLPITKILELIYTDSPHAAPGKDSANKKLNAMLDKEPRWLHPKTNSDMGRRVAELSNSPTRSPLSATAFTGRPHSFSDPTPYVPSAPGFNLDPATRPSTRNVSPFDEWSASAPTSATNGPEFLYTAPTFPDQSAQASRGSTASPGDGLGLEHSDVLEDFLRQTTFMSSSTDQTTGSFHRVLSDYSEPYIRTVRRLVKRFTIPNNNRRSVSPISERPEPAQTSWLDDDDAPSAFRERPYPLPGDFLKMDMHLQPSFANFAVPDSPWMAQSAPTADALRLRSGNIVPADANLRDAFGNTIFHFFAACGTIELVLYALRMGFSASVLNERNSAGQTFLHLANRDWIKDFRHLADLVGTLRDQGFDLYARDHYGRNFFHVLRQEEIDASNILQDLEPNLYAKRDAFNTVPYASFASGDAMDFDSLDAEANAVPGIMLDSRFLRYIRCAQEHPQLEDADGRNGLHCLAMVSLSVAQAAGRAGGSLHPATPEGQRRRSQGQADILDSSEDRLNLRQNLLSALLQSGVDPNHYDHHGNTPLMAFAAELPEDDDYKTGPKILETLIDYGADVNARNRAGETALHIAVRCGRKLAMRTLVKRGANVFARDAAGRSVLDVADVKMAHLSDDDPVAYAHFEACRAWLSGQGRAVQCPSAAQEWRAVRSS